MRDLLKYLARLPLRITDAYLDLWRREAGILATTTLIAMGISLAISAVSYGIQALLAPKPPPVVGPRLDDLGQPTTNPGRPIPKATGRNITSAQIIWSTGLKETRNTEKVKGGKGGGKSTKVVTFTYSTSLAIAFNDGEICGVERLIANGSKVIWSNRIGTSLTTTDIDAQVQAKYDAVFTAQSTFWAAVVDGETGGLKYTAAQVTKLANRDALNESEELRDELESVNLDNQPRYGQIEFFYGTEIQDPSSIIEAVEGAGNVSAFRGTAYLVIEDLELADFGNFPPGFTVDYATAGDDDQTVTINQSPAPSQAVRFGGYVMDYQRRKIFAPDVFTGGTFTSMVEFDMDTLAEVQVHDMTTAAGGAADLRGIDEATGYLHGAHDISGARSRAYVYDPVTLAWITETLTESTAFIQQVSDSWPGAFALITSADGTQKAIISTDKFADSDLRNNVTNYPEMTFHSRFGTPVNVTDPEWRCGTPMALHGSNVAWIAWVNTDFIWFWSYTMENDGTVTSLPYTKIPRTQFHASDTFASGLETVPFLDIGDGALITYVVAGSTDWFFKWDPAADDGTIIWKTDQVGAPSENTAMGHTRIGVDGVLLIYTDSFVSVHRINAKTGAVTEILTDTPDPPGGGFDLGLGSVMWDGVGRCLYSINVDSGLGTDPIKTYCFGGCLASQVSLRDVIENFTTRAGFAASEIDVAASLREEFIWGFSDNSGRSTRDMLEDLVRIRPIVVNEVEGKIKFQLADQSNVATIPKADVRAYDGSSAPPDWLTEVQTLEDLALPKTLRITYQDIDRALNPTTSIFTREITQSKTIIEFAVQAVDTAEAMRNSVLNGVSVLMASKRTFKLSVPLKYIVLEPGDVITIPVSETRTAQVRVSQGTLGANNIIELECALFIDTNLGITHTDQFTLVETDTATGAQASDLHLLDIPYLTDAAELTAAGDEDDGIYVALSSRSGTWPGANLYLDRLTAQTETAFGVASQPSGAPDWELVASASTPVAVGALVIAPDPLASALVQDVNSEMVVSFRTPDAVFATVADAVALSTQDNVFLVGDELIQAQTVTLLNTKEGFTTYQMTNLWRGLQGTEWAIGTLAEGDVVVHMDPGGIQRVDLENADLFGLGVGFRAVTIGSDLTAVATTTHTYTAASRKPWAPSVEDVTRNEAGDITITLMQRNRYGSLWTPAVPPFESDPQNFEVDVLPLFGGSPTAERTISVSDTTTITYSAAEQAVDFGSPLTSAVTIRAYQLNSAGRRGFPREVTI